jgi:2-amino-4-hydroxy-6-hydroxymethyldihydropteridine diphosphokinase
VHRVFVALGSNIDSEHNMREAIRRLAARCALIAVSSVYETAPVGKTDQPSFLNAAALIETELPPRALKEKLLRAIEQELGRVRRADKNAPRTIDLDIVLYDDQVLDVGQRHIPDPDILAYPHIAVPLAELEPDYRHPETGQTLAQIATALPQADVQRRPDIVLGV